jgi:hypothetical protein
VSYLRAYAVRVSKFDRELLPLAPALRGVGVSAAALLPRFPTRRRIYYFDRPTPDDDDA